MTRKFVSVLAIIVLGICLLSGGCFPFSDDRNLKSWRDILRIGPDENNNDTPLNLEPIQPQLENEDQKDRIGVRLYFGKPDGYGLVAEERLITKTEGIARQTLQELLKGPDSSNCLNIFPEGLKIAIVGDILHSRVARSNIYGLTKYGCEIRVVGPATLIPPEIENLGVKSYYSLDRALEGVDVINILRIQKERQQIGLFPSLDEYANLYGLGLKHLARAKDDVLVLHPGPMNRGVEISSELAESTYAVINEQVTNGVAVRMALLFLMMGGSRDEIAY
jgi:hypothetical protein